LTDYPGELPRVQGDLSFKEGNIIVILKKEEDWWVGELDGKIGWLPADFVYPLPKNN